MSSFAKNANLSNDIFRYETRMHPCSMKVQQNRQKCHAAIPPEKSDNSKNWINFFYIHSCSTNYEALSVDIITSHCLCTHTQNHKSDCDPAIANTRYCCFCQKSWRCAALPWWVLTLFCFVATTVPPPVEGLGAPTRR